VEALLARHARVALQFSGGKDSLACLYLLRPWLERITVYWVNARDALPETLRVINECRAWIPHFVEISTNVVEWRERNGYPSDLVPTYSTPVGRLLGFGTLKVTDRFTCCAANIMQPMHERMRADGITLIIRGQKLVDMPTVPVRSGQAIDGVEFFFPLEDWTHEEVLRYLAEAVAPVHPCYENGVQGVDCMHCTAWWNEGHFRFLKQRHPDAFDEVIGRVGEIARALDTHVDDLRALSDLSGE